MDEESEPETRKVDTFFALGTVECGECVISIVKAVKKTLVKFCYALKIMIMHWANRSC